MIEFEESVITTSGIYYKGKVSNFSTYKKGVRRHHEVLEQGRTRTESPKCRNIQVVFRMRAFEIGVRDFEAPTFSLTAPVGTKRGHGGSNFSYLLNLISLNLEEGYFAFLVTILSFLLTK